MRRSSLVMLLALAAALAGCATAVGRGQSALGDGRYDEAQRHFKEALAADPDRVDALIGLGLAHYRVGDFEAAAEALQGAVTRAPRAAAARLYLALSDLQRGRPLDAVASLAVYRDVVPWSRLAEQADRVIDILRRHPLPDDIRRYVVSSLESEALWAREVAATRRALNDYYFYGGWGWGWRVGWRHW